MKTAKKGFYARKEKETFKKMLSEHHGPYKSIDEAIYDTRTWGFFDDSKVYFIVNEKNKKVAEVKASKTDKIVKKF